MGHLADFIADLPKAELHLHIEGTLEPELLFALAERNGITIPYPSIESLRSAYRFGNLQNFLDLYYQGMSVLVEEVDFHDLAWAYFERAHAQAVRHAEVFFDPQAHILRGVPYTRVIDGLHRAAGEAEAKLGMTVRLILCFLRDRPVDEAMATLETALRYRDRIVGVGLDSAERDHPPGAFAAVFARARAAGLYAVAHAGEEGPAAYVREALDVLKAERIDHGVRSLEDSLLVRRLVEEQIPLTVCPLSNVRLGVATEIGRHPFRDMLDAGLFVTVNSDDPAYFGGYVNENYQAVAEAFALDMPQLRRLAANSFRASFLEEAEKRARLAEVASY